MVFSNEHKGISTHHYVEKRLTAYKTWNENKGWDKSSVKRLIKRLDEYGAMDRQKGSGRQRTAVTSENEERVEELICSQENNPDTHVSPGDCERSGDIAPSVKRIIKAKNKSI